MCTKTLGHYGKCEHLPNNSRLEASRVPDIIDTLAGLQVAETVGSDGRKAFHYRKIIPLRVQQRPVRRGRDDSDEEEVFADEPDDPEGDEIIYRRYIDRRTGELNLDWVQPYVPSEREVAESAWV